VREVDIERERERGRERLEEEGHCAINIRGEYGRTGMSYCVWTL